MLKTTVGDSIWLVHQPDHARVSGYLAAHWGGVHDFARPGHFPGSVHGEVWRQEVVLAVAEHDNGWWEWEASPPIDPADGLPLGLGDMARRQPQDGLQRWRLGVPRLAGEHPYAALLISLHPYWLYAFAFADLVTEADDPFRHALFGRPKDPDSLVADRDATRRLLDEMTSIQQKLRSRLEAEADWAAAVDPAHLSPHFKLLQLLDAMSLLLSMNVQGEQQLADVPRREWGDRVTLTWRPLGNQRILCDPYPFDADPLEVLLPTRVLTPAEHTTALPMPLTRLHALPLSTIRFELCSPETAGQS